MECNLYVKTNNDMLGLLHWLNAKHTLLMCSCNNLLGHLTRDSSKLFVVAPAGRTRHMHTNAIILARAAAKQQHHNFIHSMPVGEQPYTTALYETQLPYTKHAAHKPLGN